MTPAQGVSWYLSENNSYETSGKPRAPPLICQHKWEGESKSFTDGESFKYLNSTLS